MLLGDGARPFLPACPDQPHQIGARINWFNRMGKKQSFTAVCVYGGSCRSAQVGTDDPERRGPFGRGGASCKSLPALLGRSYTTGMA
jgi:hypothetical protein